VYRNGSTLGSAPIALEKVLEHTDDDVGEIYDRYDHAEEKRVAHQRLDD
jgi:hypothetical protein